MTLQRMTPLAVNGATKSRSADSDAATSKVQLKAALRGQDLDTQVQMLSPGGGGAKAKPAKSAGKGGSAKGASKVATKAPAKPASKGSTKGEAPVDGDPKQLLLDQMAREWRAGELAEYESLKAHYQKTYGPVPGEEGEAPAAEGGDKRQMEQLLGTYWRNGELEEFEGLKKVYEKTYGAY